MTPTFKFDQREFDKAAKDLSSTLTRKTVPEFLKDQARLLTRDLIKLTPPTSKNPFRESFNVQKKTGEKAIELDVKTVFHPLDGVNIMSGPRSKSLWKLARAGRFSELKSVLVSAGLRVVSIAKEVDGGLYKRIRGTGYGRRLRRNKPMGNLVVNAASIKQFIEGRKKLLGISKAGWLVAARALLVRGIPAWISRHRGQGEFIDRTGRGTVAEVEIRNNVPFLKNEQRIVDRALRERTRAMRVQFEKIMEKEARKFNAK